MKDTDFQCMKNVVNHRHSIRAFSGEAIEEGVMEEIIGYALRCPTSMNVQPYRLILVRDQDKKEELSSCMDPGNDETVKTSGATLIVLADQQPVQSVKDFGQYVYSDDQPPSVRKMTQFSFIAYYNNTFWNWLFGWILDLFMWLGHFFVACPSRISNQGWSFQQSSFLIESLVLLAQSKGIGSLIMEGFNEKALRNTFHIPQRYQIASIVSFGYPSKRASVDKTPRYPFNEMVFDKKWGNTYN